MTVDVIFRKQLAQALQNGPGMQGAGAGVRRRFGGKNGIEKGWQKEIEMREKKKTDKDMETAVDSTGEKDSPTRNLSTVGISHWVSDARAICLAGGV